MGRNLGYQPLRAKNDEVIIKKNLLVAKYLRLLSDPFFLSQQIIGIVSIIEFNIIP
jgi:hypothetical protein